MTPEEILAKLRAAKAARSAPDQGSVYERLKAAKAARAAPQEYAPDPARARQAARVMGMDAPAAAQPSLVRDGRPAVEPTPLNGYQPPAPQVDALQTAAIMAGQGATFGFSDEINAGIRSVLPGQTYQNALAGNQRMISAAQDQNPKTAFAADLAGSVAAPLPFVGPALGATKSVIPATMAGKAMTGAAAGVTLGAAEGALSAAGRADQGERGKAALKGAAIGAATGGVVGAMAPVVATGLRNLAQTIKGKDTSVIARVLGISKGAATVVSRALEAGDLNRAQTALRSAGADAMLADAGDATKQLLDGAMQAGGKALQIGRDAIETRAASAQKRISSVFDSVLGIPEGVKSMSRGISVRTAAARQSAYDRAYSKPIDYAAPEGLAVEGVLQRVDPATMNAAIDEANAAMRDAGVKNLQIKATIANDGSVTFAEMPNTQQLDEIKKGLDAVAERETDAVTGRITAKGRRARMQASDLKAAISSANSAYAGAVKIGGDKIAEQNALDIGRKLLTTPLERAQEVLSGASQEALTAARRGFRTYIDDTMANVRRTIGDANVDAREALKPIIALSSRDAERKMRLLLTPQQFTKIREAIDESAMHLQLRADTAANSKTAPRIATKAAIDEVTAPNAARVAMEGRPVEAARQIVQALTGAGPDIRVADQQAIYAEIATALTSMRGQQAQSALALVDRAIAGKPMNKVQAEYVARAITSATGSVAYQTGTRDLERRTNAQ